MKRQRDEVIESVKQDSDCQFSACAKGFDAGVKAALSSPEVQGLLLALDFHFDPHKNDLPCYLDLKDAYLKYKEWSKNATAKDV